MPRTPAASRRFQLPFRLPGMGGSARPAGAALFGRKDQLFAITVVVLSAKLAKCDGPVDRAEIDAFKRQFRIPPESARDIGRLFDQARDSTDGFEAYADQLGEAFADNRGMLEDVLAALFAIARADGPLNRPSRQFLSRSASRLRAWTRRRGTGRSGAGRAAAAGAGRATDPYEVWACRARTSDEDLHAAWKQLMRENHPDSLAAAACRRSSSRARQRQGRRGSMPPGTGSSASGACDAGASATCPARTRTIGRRARRSTC